MHKFNPGVSFGDFVVEDFSKTKSRVKEELPRDYRRGWLIWMAIVVAFGILVVRLAELQLFQGGKYRVLAEENRIKTISLPAPRGLIYDRNGVVLADNQAVGDKWKRGYPYGEIMAHVLGYMGEVGEDEVGLLKEAGQKYQVGELTGRTGLEKQYEQKMRGLSGGRLIEVDNTGKEVRELGKKLPEAGQDLHTTLDVNLQRVAFRALEGRKGAVVISNPKTGEILGLVSSPSFNPNSNIADVLNKADMPMFNRSIGGVYPPGSTFKIVTTTAAIDSGKVKADFTYEDQGQIVVGQFRFSNWLFSRGGGTEGVIGFSRAITRSTDTFFYKVGELTGAEVMADWAHKFGLGQKSGIDVGGEVEGLIVTPEWKQKVKGEEWFLGNTYHMAIGQGDTLTTPLQINIMTNVIADGGIKCKPHLTKLPITNFQFPANDQCQKVQISKEALKIVREGLVGACSPGGTAFPLFGFKPQVACKTGTAEYVAENGKIRTHGWLTAYAPADNPTISVTAIVEGGGEGSNVAAPIVRKILSQYFGVEDKYNYAAIPQETGE